MKLRRVAIQNVRSFLERQEFQIPGDISIIIGPNGGGKTNLLDTAVLALRIYLLRSWVPRHNPTQDWQDRYDWAANDAIQAHLLDRHSAGGNVSQIIELDLELTAPDVENIRQAKAQAAELGEKSKSRYTSFPAIYATNWSLEGIESGKVFAFRIQDGSLYTPSDAGAETFRSYLETYEVNSRVREEFSRSLLSMPMISLPVTRSGAGVTTSVALADFNEYDYKRSVDAASSRSSGSITSLAIGRLASRYRQLIERDDGRASIEFRDDAALKKFTDTLRTLGYEWELTCTNVYRNQYDVLLKKQGSTFRVGAASSGERELLVYLFAIYALNVRDALIVVDEPELHLHPRWQQILLGMFERLSKDTGNQFIMATHSPVFVSPASIQYVSRVYSERQQSRIVRLGDSSLPERKHLFGIVNSQNNERVFFADLVVLVEGISDRIFFEAVFEHFKVGEGSGKVYEVVSVGGKMLFKQYERLLSACHIPYLIIADRDYIREIGSGEIKALFAVSSQDIKHKVIDDSTSIDAASLVDRMDDAIRTGVVEDLQNLWNYIKGRQTRLRSDLSESEQRALLEFISEERKKGRFILSEGALEAYLPAGYRSKDLERLIDLLSGDFWRVLPEGRNQELMVIVHEIASKLGVNYDQA
jgi:ABC-type lipoprotein export system ATPase subunit